MAQDEMTIGKYRRTEGPKQLRELIERFIKQAPAFEGDAKLAAEIGKNIADLEAAFAQPPNYGTGHIHLGPFGLR